MSRSPWRSLLRNSIAFMDESGPHHGGGVVTVKLGLPRERGDGGFWPSSGWWG